MQARISGSCPIARRRSSGLAGALTPLGARRALLKRWHLEGPPYPGDMSHPSDDILSLRRAVAHPCATWDISPGYGVLGDLVGRGFDSKRAGQMRRRATAIDPLAVFGLRSSVRAGSHGTAGCQARQPRERSDAPDAPKDVVLPHWGSSGTWMCRARELRQDADVSDDPQCGRTAAPSGADDHPNASRDRGGALRSR